VQPVTYDARRLERVRDPVTPILVRAGRVRDTVTHVVPPPPPAPRWRSAASAFALGSCVARKTCEAVGRFRVARTVPASQVFRAFSWKRRSAPLPAARRFPRLPL